MFEKLSFNLSGVTFGERQKALESLSKRKSLYRASLEPEPGNPHDPKAVKVTVEGAFIGYVPKDVSGLVSDILGKIIRSNVEIGYSDNLCKYYACCSLLISTEED